ncbi:MAG: hypothetical protein GY708_17340 [Actinomycetia bacterium]|nr:hypothetical protein [Actinomycetes bacterium]
MSQWRLRTSLLVIAVVCAVMAPIPTSRSASAAPEMLAQTSPTSSGYWMLESDGTVYPFGEAQDFGSADWTTSAVALVPTVTAGGYWIVSRYGGVAEYGDAIDFASAYDDVPDGETITTAAATPSGRGLWLFTDAGRVVVRGDAGHFGDLTHLALDGPIVGSSATPTGGGYLMVGGDGGVFAFGDAVFRGSVPGVLPAGTTLDKPVVGVSTSPSNLGYWMVASDGGIFAFGDSPFRGSIPGVLPGVTLNQPVNGMVPYGNGYLMVASDGGIFNFSDLEFLGSLGANPPDTAIVGVAPMPEMFVPTPSHTVFNTDLTSDVLWVTEFEDNPAGAQHVTWFGNRFGSDGKTLEPRRAEVRVDDGGSYVFELSDSGAWIRAIGTPDGSWHAIAENADGSVTVESTAPDGSQIIQTSAPALVQTPVANPPTAATGFDDPTPRAPSRPEEFQIGIDKWFVQGKGAELRINMEPRGDLGDPRWVDWATASSDFGMRWPRTRSGLPSADASCAISGNTNFDCFQSEEHFWRAVIGGSTAGYRIETTIKERLFVDADPSATVNVKVLTAEECKKTNSLVDAASKTVSVVSFVWTAISGALAVSSGPGAPVVLTVSAYLGGLVWGITTTFGPNLAKYSGDCAEISFDKTVAGNASDYWDALITNASQMTKIQVVLGADGFQFEPSTLEFDHDVTKTKIANGSVLPTRQVLVAPRDPLSTRGQLEDATVGKGANARLDVWAQGGYPAALPGGDHDYVATVWWNDAAESKTPSVFRYQDDTVENHLGQFEHSYDEEGDYTIVVTVENDGRIAWSAHTVTVLPAECADGEYDTCPDVDPITVEKTSGDWAVYKLEETKHDTLDPSGCGGVEPSASIRYQVWHAEVWGAFTMPWLEDLLETEATRNQSLGTWGRWVCHYGRTVFYEVTVLESNVSEEWAMARYAQIAQRLEARGYTETWNRFFPTNWWWEHPDHEAVLTTTAQAIWDSAH